VAEATGLLEWGGEAEPSMSFSSKSPLPRKHREGGRLQLDSLTRVFTRDTAARGQAIRRETTGPVKVPELIPFGSGRLTLVLLTLRESSPFLNHSGAWGTSSHHIQDVYCTSKMFFTSQKGKLSPDTAERS
jgi:hypothetical protein